MKPQKRCLQALRENSCDKENRWILTDADCCVENLDFDFGVLSQAEFEELDFIANLMLEPNKNFEKICDIWQNTPKFRIVSGGFN